MTRLFPFGAALLAAGSALAQPAGPPSGRTGGSGFGEPTPVGVVEVETETVPYTVTLPGRAVAYEQVYIRPRVEGVVSEIAYTPGRPVSAGDVLFRIDNETYAAEVRSAEADVARAEAELSAAQASLQRYRALEGTSVTREQVESAEVSVSQAEAGLSTAEAALQLARLELDRTEIRSPIDGVAEVPAVSVGAIVTANQADALTTVTRLDPIFVDLEESSARIQRLRERIQSGSLSPGETIGLRLQLESGTEYAGAGQLVTPGTSVSTSTGTTEIRVLFDNPDRMILPGMFLRVKATVGSTEAILVPQAATRRAADGTLTAFVARDGVAEQVVLNEAGAHENAWIVTAGLEPGDQLIVDNLRNLSDGGEVSAVPVTIAEDGVVEDTGQAPGATGRPELPAGGMPEGARPAGAMPPGAPPAAEGGSDAAAATTAEE